MIRVVNMLKLIVLLLLFVPVSQVLAHSELNEQLLLASPNTINENAELKAHMTTLAEAAIGDHCASCHGANLEGQLGVPNLTDYDWNWGVTGFEVTASEAVFEIMQSILYGIRDTDCPDDTKRYGACPDTRYSEMPGYGTLGFTEQQVSDLTEKVLAVAGREADLAAVERSESLWPLCGECHGEDGLGYVPFGGPNLSDDVWLFGGDKEQIYDVIYNGRIAVCPAYSTVLDSATIKALGVYIYNKYLGL